MTSDDFHIHLVGDLDFEQFVAEIQYKDQWLATVTQEKGPEEMVIEIFPCANAENWQLPLNQLIAALQKTKRQLIEYRD